MSDLKVSVQAQDQESGKSRTFDVRGMSMDELAVVLAYPERLFNVRVPDELQVFLAPEIPHVDMILAGQCTQIEQLQMIHDKPGDMRLTTEKLAEVWIRMFRARPPLGYYRG